MKKRGTGTLLFSITYDKTEAILLAEHKEALRSLYNKIILAGMILLIASTFYLYKLVKKLKEAERVYRTLISNIHGMVYRCKYDEYWTMEYVSEGCLAVTGYRPEDFINNAVVSYESVIMDPLF
ncbi:MAG: hypothetical protein Q7J15_00555 [Candidatus Desulfaltia sp.]|nr:hypothetical protein [Candidatus Desulfaltia sp.]